MKIGAHVSSSGGILNAIKNAQKLEINNFQMFISAPQNYHVKEFSLEEVEEFNKTRVNLNMNKCFAHAIYLLNFASMDPRILEKSKENLIRTLNISAKLKLDGVIIHIGSTKEGIETGIKKVSEAIIEILENTDPSISLFLENSAGSGNYIGSDINHLVDIININKGNKRLQVCLDTQHLYGAGYDIKTNPIEVLDLAFSKLENRIQVIHLNDSKVPLNSKKDRHENIGEGLIGYESLKIFCTDSRLDNIPLILEVPGFDNNGPDVKNIEIVKSFFK